MLKSLDGRVRVLEVRDTMRSRLPVEEMSNEDLTALLFEIYGKREFTVDELRAIASENPSMTIEHWPLG